MEDKSKIALNESEYADSVRPSVEESLTSEDLPQGILSQLTSKTFLN
jgi:hypothetical protein